MRPYFQAGIFSILVLFLVLMSGASLYELNRELAFYKDFKSHVNIMDEFLAGWSKYDNLIESGEAEILLKIGDEEFPRFSCEAVFMRDHLIVTDPATK